MNFFFDANISRLICGAISLLYGDEHRVVHNQDREDFKRNNVLSPSGQVAGNTTEDLEWITSLGRSGEGWGVISGDSDIVDTAHERAALTDSGLTFFACDTHRERIKFPEQAWKFVKTWGEIVRSARDREGSLFRVRAGKKLGIETIRAGERARGGNLRG